MEQDSIFELNLRFKKSKPEDLLKFFIQQYKGTIALASSLSLEDQVLTHMIAGIDPFTRIFTLDTGRLFQESYEVLERTRKKYGISIEIFFPDAREVESMINARGINLFYNSISDRKLCCKIRKINPLKRAFSGLDGWICGLRSEQSVTRINTKKVEWDAGNGLLKINPLVDWSEGQVWDYIKAHDIPYNILHERGFPSIGCQCCTRAVEPGEDIRAGRWWWEEPEKKECGLHLAK